MPKCPACGGIAGDVAESESIKKFYAGIAQPKRTKRKKRKVNVKSK